MRDVQNYFRPLFTNNMVQTRSFYRVIWNQLQAHACVCAFFGLCDLERLWPLWPREREREREREKDTERGRERERERQRDRERQRQRHRERQSRRLIWRGKFFEKYPVLTSNLLKLLQCYEKEETNKLTCICVCLI